MDSLYSRGAAKTRVMQGHSKPVDGFSDTSSAGSILDEADREVSSLTERAFKSLCVLEEGMCTEFQVHSSPSAAPGSGGKKHSVGELTNCNMSPKLIKKQSKELPKTFQESAGRCPVGEDQWDKGNMQNGFLTETTSSNNQKSKVPTRVETFDQCDGDFAGTDLLGAKPALAAPSEPGEDPSLNVAQFDASAIVNMHREKSSFSSTCQESYWLNKNHLPQEKVNKTNILEYLKSSHYRKPADLKNLRHAGKIFDKTLSEKVNRLKKSDGKSSFLHSECSAFKSWQDHTKSLLEEDLLNEAHSPRFQSTVHTEGSDIIVRTQKQTPSIVQVKSPNKVKVGVRGNPVNWSLCNKDTDVHTSASKENHYTVKGNEDHGNSSQIAKPREDIGGAVENGVEEKGFQLWRNSRYPLYKKQMEADLVSREVSGSKCPPVTEATTLSAPNPQGESHPFCISKLLAPNIVPNANGIAMSNSQPIVVVTPPLIQPSTNQGEEIKGDNQSNLGYKSKASSLMYNLKDVRKRVKSTYPMAGTPKLPSETAKNKQRVFQNLLQASTRTSSAPVQLRENSVTNTNEQGKFDRIPSTEDTRPPVQDTRLPADGLKAAMVRQAVLEAWKNDDYLNLRSPQTVKDGDGYPSWRTKISRPHSAMEVDTGRGKEERAAHQPNKLRAKEKPYVLATTFQKRPMSARGNSEGVANAQEKQTQFHGNSAPKCDLDGNSPRDPWSHECHSGRQGVKLASQRVRDIGYPAMDWEVSSNQGSSHSTREDKTRHDLKSSGQPYIDLGNSPEHVMVNYSKEQFPGMKDNALKSRLANENKYFEKNELQYYTLSDPTTNPDRGTEKENTPMIFQSHSQQETAQGLAEQKAKDRCPGTCEEKFDSIFSKQEERRPGNNTPTSPRHLLFKVKDSAPKTSSGAKPSKLILPKGAGEDCDVNSFSETPTPFVSDETPEDAKVDTGEQSRLTSVTPKPRSESACSLDSKAAGKPPVVPPKSEKALRRAKKLATRRKRAENKQRNTSGDVAENEAALSNVPMSPLNRPTSPVHTVCSPEPQQQDTSSDFPALPNKLPLNTEESIASLHSFPISQRKLLQDPETGQYFVVDIPFQVQSKTLFDPETGNYFQVSIPSTGQNTTLDFLNTSYVLYPGFLSLPLMSALRPPSQMSAPAVLLELQNEGESLNERTNFDLGHTQVQEIQPYIETLYEPCNGSRAGSEKEAWSSTMTSQEQPENHNLELIVMGELEDIAIENN
ncbi:cardiac-enriched FHL2-interacting protein [Narcine bancroftii]|uniref:cardiac-enriched FHL2-interacting protein n=1 Tax=Narcine bancroftii TaxID=1343680 RepID=UPI003832233F